MPQLTKKMFRVGFWMSEKKIRKLNFSAYCDRLRRDHDIDMVLLTLDKPLEQQGPFDLVMHKLTDVMAAADAGDERSEAAVRRAETFFSSQPGLRMLDPLSAVRNLTDRDTCYSVMKGCTKTIGGVEIASPNFVTIYSNTADKAEALRQADVSFPIVCKPIVAHGSDLAHKMAIIFNEEHLCDMQTPCVAQQFVNHSAVLHKVFVIGEYHHLVERPSIKNLVAGDHETIFFDSHHVSKATSDSYLNQMDESTNGLPKPNEAAISWLVKRLRETMSLNLFGVDIIIENETNRHIFIDVNYFPGYDGVTDMFDAFTKLLQAELECVKVERSAGSSSSDSKKAPSTQQNGVERHESCTASETSAAATTLSNGRLSNGHVNGVVVAPAATLSPKAAKDTSMPPSLEHFCNGSSSSVGSSITTCVHPMHRDISTPLVNGHELADSIMAKRPYGEYDASIVDAGSTSASCSLTNGHRGTLHVVS